MTDAVIVRRPSSVAVGDVLEMMPAPNVVVDYTDGMRTPIGWARYVVWVDEKSGQYSTDIGLLVRDPKTGAVVVAGLGKGTSYRDTGSRKYIGFRFAGEPRRVQNDD